MPSGRQRDDKDVDLLTEAYRRNPTAFAEMAEVIYGETAAWELVSKLSNEEQRRNKTQARVALASNAVGITAGAAGTAASIKQFREKKLNPESIDAPITRKVFGAFKKVPSKKVLVGGLAAAAGLQGANLAGDFVANRVLSREANKKVSKGLKIVGPKNMHPIDVAAEGFIKARKKFPGRTTLQREVADQMGVSQGSVSQAVRRKMGTYATGNQLRPGKGLHTVNPSKEQAARQQAYWAGQVKKNRGSFEKVQTGVIWKGEISKRDDDKRQVFGWASVVEVGGKPVVDHQDDLISVDVIEKAAYDYVKSSRKGGDMHRRAGDAPVHVSDMIESFLVTPEKKAALGLPDDMPTGWWVGFQVNDEETWQKVKTGERTEFSIHGSGRRISKMLED